MDTQINLLKRTLKVLIAFLFLFALTIGCNDGYFETEIANDELNELKLKSQVIHEGPIQLVGATRFVYFNITEGIYYADGNDVFLPCEAELTFGEKQSFILSTKEYFGTDLYREVIFNGKMTTSGQLKFDWPDEWLEFGEIHDDVLGQMFEHTGMTFSGPGINKTSISFKGDFDGEKFVAEMRLIGKQEQLGTMFFLPDELIKGPVLLRIIFDLHVVN